MKDIDIGKNGIRLTLFTDDTSLYTENSRVHKKRLKIIAEFSKTARYKINT